MQRTHSMGITEFSDATSRLWRLANRLRFPSPQRERGVSGEGKITRLIEPGKRAAASNVLPPHSVPPWTRGDFREVLGQQTSEHKACHYNSRSSVSEKLARHRGFTLIELMMVLTVISILVSIAIPIANSAIIRSKEAVLRSNLYTLRTLIDQYTADKLKAPQTLDDIVAAGYLRSLPKDPITDRNDTWQIVMEDASLFPEQTETGIFDVHSGSTATSTEGTPYSDW
jgi:general secretion pathway protein G